MYFDCQTGCDYDKSDNNDDDVVTFASISAPAALASSSVSSTKPSTDCKSPNRRGHARPQNAFTALMSSGARLGSEKVSSAHSTAPSPSLPPVPSSSSSGKNAFAALMSGGARATQREAAADSAFAAHFLYLPAALPTDLKEALLNPKDGSGDGGDDDRDSDSGSGGSGCKPLDAAFPIVRPKITVFNNTASIPRDQCVQGTAGLEYMYVDRFTRACALARCICISDV